MSCLSMIFINDPVLITRLEDAAHVLITRLEDDAQVHACLGALIAVEPDQALHSVPAQGKVYTLLILCLVCSLNLYRRNSSGQPK